jgi:serine/threonine protein kinase/tetratricopeptide (TPR) repeat protein
VPSEVWNRLEQVLDRFESAWNRGSRPALAEYLAAAEAERRLLLIELAHEDLEYRLRSGEPVRVETYLERYPELRGDAGVILDLIALEYDCRRESDAGDLVGELRRRFPEYASELDSCLTPFTGAAPRRPEPVHLPEPPTPHATSPAEPTPSLPHVPGYEFLGVLGRGGMGVVYKARQVGLKRLVALKMLAAGVLAEPQELARFRAEAEAAAALQHPTIVPIYEVAAHQGQPYFAMELIEGGSLAQAVGREEAPRRVAELIETLARAIHYAHQRGIVHRDLKPANILLRRKSEIPNSKSEIPNPQDNISDFGFRISDFEPKVTDFGLAKRLAGETAGTQTGVILGTPSYMAPEQASGRTRDIGPATDVYALGAILYEMLLGRPPFQGETPLETLQQVREREAVPPRRLRPAVPRDLETICLKCLQKEPGRRYASAQALADDLRRFVNGEPVLARPVGAWERTIKWARRRPLAAALVLVSLLAVAGLLVGTVWIEEARRQADREAAQARLQEQRARENYERAEHSYRLARASMESCLAEIRKDPRFQGGPLESVRKLLLQAELKFYEQFAAQRGDEPAFKAERAEAYLNLARITGELEGADKALGPFRQAVDLFTELTRDYPENADYQARLAESYYHLSQYHADAGRFQEAVQTSEAALALIKSVSAKHPAESRYQSQTVTVLIGLSTLYGPARRAREAEEALTEALALLNALTAKHPDDPGHAYNRAECLTNLAVRYANAGRIEEAMRARRQALETVQSLVKRYPENPEYRFYLGIFSSDMGLLYRIAQRSSEAGQAFQDAVAALKPLADEHPAVARFARGLAYVRVCRAGFIRDTGELEDAVRAYTEAAADLEAAAGETRGEDAVRSVLRDAYAGRAKALDRLKRLDEALADWDRALELDKGPMVAANLRLFRAVTLVRRGDHARATAEADAVVNGDQVSHRNLYNAAVVFSLASAVVGDDAPLKERHAARSVGLLCQAVTKGFPPDVSRFETEPYLAPVRQREDFRQLLRELEERRKSSKTDVAPDQ